MTEQIEETSGEVTETPVVETTKTTETPEAHENILDTLDFEDSGDLEDGVQDIIGDPEEKEPVVVAAGETVEEVKAIEVKTEEPKVEEVKTEEPKVEPVAAEPVEPVVAAAPEPTKEERAEQYQTQKAELQKQYESQFQLTEEQADRMTTEPEKVLPELLSQVFINSYEALYFGIMQQMQPLLNNVLDKRTTLQTTQDEFWSANPEIAEHIKANPQSAQQLSHLGNAWQAMNPGNTDRQQAITGIGKLAMAHFGLATTPAAPAAAPKTIPPRTPAAATARPGANNGSPVDDIQSMFDYEDPED